MNESLDQRRQEFEKAVAVEFSFLETDHGYQVIATPPELSIVAFGNASSSIGVQVTIELRECDIYVALFETSDGQYHKYSFWGQVGRRQGIALCTYVDLLTGDDDDALPFPPDRLCTTQKESMLRMKERRLRMDADMKGVVRQFADQLKQYGLAILAGDTSMFPEVHAHHLKSQGMFLSKNGRRVQAKIGDRIIDVVY